MNKKFMAMMAASLMAGFSMAGAHAAASDTTVNGGTINFEGDVVDAACSVTTDSVNQTVTMGQVRTAQFAAKGDLGGVNTPFNIVLDDCASSVSTNVAVTFSGAADSVESGALANVAAGNGAASGVALQISEEDGTVLDLDSESTGIKIIDGTTTLPFTVDYISTSDTVAAGHVSASATFSLHYS